MSYDSVKTSRRTILTQAGRGAAGVLAATVLTSCDSLQVGPTGKPADKIRFGFTTYQWGMKWDLPTLIDNCRKAQVFGAELRTSLKYARGKGFEHNFNLVKDKLASTMHVHDLEDPGFPYQLQMDLLVKIGWKGWALLEQGGQPQHPVKSLIEQRQIWERMLEKSLKV